MNKDMHDALVPLNYLIGSFIISVVRHNQDLMDCCEVHPRAGITHSREGTLWG